MAGLNLGILLQEHGDFDGAAAAYRGAVDRGASPHSGNAALNLGLLLSKIGDLPGARTAFETAAREEDVKLASRAEFMLGSLLEKSRPAEAAEALRRAVAAGDPEIAPGAAYLLGELLSAGLGSVPAEQTYLYITQGNRVFDSLYDTDLPPLGRDCSAWPAVLSRAGSAPADIVPGLLQSTLRAAGVEVRVGGGASCTFSAPRPEAPAGAERRKKPVSRCPFALPPGGR